MDAEVVEPTGLVVHEVPKAVVKQSLFDLEPDDQVLMATKIANSLTKVIEKQRLFHDIQGKKYVKVEGWELLGTFLGILPRERSVIEREDGSFEAAVDLIRASDGVVIGGASAICGTDERRWKTADRYARRSMAVTRAVGKAYRSSFSWIISLAGYATTPAEEMPRDEHRDIRKESPRSGSVYTGETSQQEKVKAILEKEGVDEERWQEVHDKLLNKPSTYIFDIIKSLRGDA